MKRIISFLLILCTLLSVCSCTKSNVLDEETALPSVQEQEKEATDSEIKQQEQTDKEQSNKEQSNTEKPKQEPNTQTDKEQQNTNTYKADKGETEGGAIIGITDTNQTVDEAIIGAIINDGDTFKNDSKMWLEIDFPINDIVDCISPCKKEGIHMIITKTNELYYISLNKSFSNGFCYLKVNTDMKFKKFISAGEFSSYIISTDNKIYYIGEIDILNCDENLKFSACLSDVVNERGINENLIYISNRGSLDYEWYTYNNNKIFSLDGKEVYSFSEDECIKSVRYGYVQTQKGFYEMTREPYQEFADSEVTYKLVAEFIENSSEYNILYKNLSTTVAIPQK